MAVATSRLRVRVAPGGRRSAVVGRYGDAWKIRVVALPERGRANDEVVMLLAGALGLAQSDLRLVAGAASRSKIIELNGLEADEANRRLELASERPTGVAP